MTLFWLRDFKGRWLVEKELTGKCTGLWQERAGGKKREKLSIVPDLQKSDAYRNQILIRNTDAYRNPSLLGCQPLCQSTLGLSHWAAS